MKGGGAVIADFDTSRPRRYALARKKRNETNSFFCHASLCRHQSP